jgi:hypothetical protein
LCSNVIGPYPTGEPVVAASAVLSDRIFLAPKSHTVSAALTTDCHGAREQKAVIGKVWTLGRCGIQVVGECHHPVTLRRYLGAANFWGPQAGETPGR